MKTINKNDDDNKTYFHDITYCKNCGKRLGTSAFIENYNSDFCTKDCFDKVELTFDYEMKYKFLLKELTRLKRFVKDTKNKDDQLLSYRYEFPDTSSEIDYIILRLNQLTQRN